MTLEPGNVDQGRRRRPTPAAALSAAGAIELATHGNWKGTWSKSPAAATSSRRSTGSRCPRTGAEVLGVLGQRRAGIAGDLRIQAQARRQHPVLPGLLRQEVPAQRRRARGEGSGDRDRRAARRSVAVTAYARRRGKPSPKARRDRHRRRREREDRGGGSGDDHVHARPGASRWRSAHPTPSRTEARVCVDAPRPRTRAGERSPLDRSAAGAARRRRRSRWPAAAWARAARRRTSSLLVTRGFGATGDRFEARRRRSSAPTP